MISRKKVSFYLISNPQKTNPKHVANAILFYF